MTKEINEISKEKLSKYVKRAVSDHGMANFAKRQTTRPDEKKYYAKAEQKRHKGISMAINKLDNMKEDEMEQLDEATKKHFKAAAETIKAIEDPEKRREHASIHADIYAKQNPRFDRAKFMKAAGVNEDEEYDDEIEDIEDAEISPAEEIVNSAVFENPVGAKEAFAAALGDRIATRIGEIADEMRAKVFAPKED